MTKRSAALSVAALIFMGRISSAHAAADTKECIAAFDQGQHSKTDHHLKLAQTQLLACTKETCPSVLRADCADVLKSVQSAIPSVVLAAEDGGKDVTDVKVSNGTDIVAASLDAKAIELDPGTYDFRFERGSQPPLTVHFVLREGEKNREVRGIFNPPKPVARPLPPPVQLPRSVPGYIVPAAFGTIGVAGFVVAGLTRLAFNKDVDNFRAVCAPNCTEQSRAELSTTLVRANVAFGVAIGSVVIAAITWFVLSPGTKQPAPTSAALTW